ncbi:conserved Plasmodium protein, unknown function [Plasmodium gallinaceum]|uniref:Uncharacterized protein n=1 Tax=Plasmodium gallinaceum TaxID=5849 RepID=A0A1J1GR24_PLAGA|nr:conserved Plasmodium protein, unknown function [Plasmodium gallinaceum]CRG94916.1 conserved Plasmodium protein, unknown function [Plasmodium gallinaceum]
MYATNSKTNFYSYGNNNYDPYKSYPGNDKVMGNSDNYESQYYSDGGLNLMNSHINKNDIYYKAQQNYPYDTSIYNDMQYTPLSSLHAATFNQNKNRLQNFNHNSKIFEKDTPVDNYRNSDFKIRIKNNRNKINNCNDQMDEVNDINYNSTYEDEESYDTPKNERNTVINITYDDKSSENDCIEDNEQNIYNFKKIKKPKKKFMGKYFFSEIKNNFLSPLHICAPHPTLTVPNFNCFHYKIVEKTKGKKNEKPEIVVRY